MLVDNYMTDLSDNLSDFSLDAEYQGLWQDETIGSLAKPNVNSDGNTMRTSTILFTEREGLLKTGILLATRDELSSRYLLPVVLVVLLFHEETM